MSQKTERRKYPRVKDQEISIKLSGEGFNAVTQSLDISASGVYCTVKERIPLMTRVQIRLIMPCKGGGASTTMDVEGVVVREKPLKKDGHVQNYDIAIFFDFSSPREREKIIKYLEKKGTAG
ncbi:MAG: PilZ domain-containing protein [Candidatus Omnitrophota bacterium]